MKPALEEKKVIVFGLGKSGVAAAQLLLAQGARVTGVDQKSEEQLGEPITRLRRKGLSLALGPIRAGLLSSADLVVVSPGVPLASAEIQQAKAAAVKVWGEVELASRFLKGPMVGITGTNGKSTTTALTGQLFASAGWRAFVGGNLGRPLSEAALDPQPFQAYVIELSSFQLEGIEALRLQGAALLNLAPDHLDRYPSHSAYGAAKARIFLNQLPEDAAVVNADDPAVVSLASAGRARLYGFSLHRSPAAASPLFRGGAVARAPGFQIALNGEPPQSYSISNRVLRGSHNLQNAMAAALLARLSGISEEAVQRGLDAFPGLPHRLEWVRTLDGVEWINDSKATNVDSALVALKALPGRIWLIAGGKGKGSPYEPMVEAGRGKVKGVLTLGEDAAAIERAFAPECAVHACKTLSRAVERARSLSTPGDVVLLSPACASYDQFENFEQRGELFKRLVREL
jgi:UDP-N-acetylmuramoylalanine--D-glutamate ligase